MRPFSEFSISVCFDSKKSELPPWLALFVTQQLRKLLLTNGICPLFNYILLQSEKFTFKMQSPLLVLRVIKEGAFNSWRNQQLKNAKLQPGRLATYWKHNFWLSYIFNLKYCKSLSLCTCTNWPNCSLAFYYFSFTHLNLGICCIWSQIFIFIYIY